MIAKHTSDAISSSAASTVSSSFVASRPATRKPPELTSRCYASQQQGSGSKLSTRPRRVDASNTPHSPPSLLQSSDGDFSGDVQDTSPAGSRRSKQLCKCEKSEATQCCTMQGRLRGTNWLLV